MIVETFLDYNEVVKVIFNIENGNIDYDFECTADGGKMSSNIIENLHQLSVLENSLDSDVCVLKISDTIFVNISKTTGEMECINTLTAFETRSLAQGKFVGGLFERGNKSDFIPKTDLHTHFAGALSPDIILEVALEHDLSYPLDMLRECEIEGEKYNIDKDGLVRLQDISDEDIEKLKSELMISQVTQETFNKMEDIYRLRGPFTKNKALFKDYLRELAKDYEEKGVEYAELSFSAFISDPEYMTMMEECIPQIESETGVKLRFLAGIWRHSDKEWNLDDVDRIKSVAKSRYVVGCDVMGHETNSTDSVKEELCELARYAMESDPEFVIRVHAGENPIFSDNVAKALEIIYGEYGNMPEGTPMPKVRIGHGLYGVDEKVLALAKEMGAIIEFNMSSNLALNNIDAISEVPIAEYIKNGIKVVLATDGHGMYSTSGEQETILASAAGVGKEDFGKIAEVENEVMNMAIQREEKHPAVKNVQELYDFTYTTGDGKPRYTREVGERYRAKKAQEIEHLKGKIGFTGAVTDLDEIARVTEGKTPIALTGASRSSWPNISESDQENIRVVMQVLANTLNPETSYLVTGGTNHGVEKELHEAVNRRNKDANEELVLLGTLTLEAADDAIAQLSKDTITHATILELNGRLANGWQDLPDTQLEYVQQKGGCMVAVGGGNIVNNMIQRAHNMGMDMHLMDGPCGASTNKSKSLAGNGYSFETGEELITRLYEKNQLLFNANFSLEDVSKYVEQARLQVRETMLSGLENEEKTISEAERLVKALVNENEKDQQNIKV